MQKSSIVSRLEGAFQRFAVSTFFLIACCARLSAAPSEDGMFATFSISRGGTPIGEFTCKLEFELAPRTVANFVGLAEGSRAWVNFQGGGRGGKPFYDGITFHRVVLEPTPFVIQGGSPNGTGSDGPGYAFRDEFRPSLRHSKAGILSMANSGPDSNGSQFFVTLTSTPHLDDLHSVFGEIVENMNVVLAVREGDVIDHVTITRNGAAAQAFDVNAHGLPVVEEAAPLIARTETSLKLNYDLKNNAEYFVFHSDDLSSWLQIIGEEFYVAPPLQSPRDVSALTSGKTKKFFTIARVQYSDVEPVKVETGRRMHLSLAGGGSFTFDFTTATSGLYSTSLAAGGPFSILNYTVTRTTARARILTTERSRIQATISGLSSAGDPITGLDLNLNFNDSSNGNASGFLSTASGPVFSLSGTFVLSNF